MLGSPPIAHLVKAHHAPEMGTGGHRHEANVLIGIMTTERSKQTLLQFDYDFKPIGSDQSNEGKPLIWVHHSMFVPKDKYTFGQLVQIAEVAGNPLVYLNLEGYKVKTSIKHYNLK